MTLSSHTVAIIVTIGSLVVPPVTSLLKKEQWSAQLKQLIAGVLSIAVAVAGIALTAPNDFGLPLVSLGGLVYAGSQIIYGAYFKNSVLDNKLTGVFSRSAKVKAK